ncbi:KpsF/GutQ family protein [Methylobacterium sp. 4-46]|uniref:KpsF/GutQ family sugar-phosphate isomerase n=1 Tax=unclassified Methylobacterium TaxID=2615210 RepID=UPI000152E06E|nr:MULTISPECIES: KpsF/GutQ family sugar-phosphate isomerase [Methylobacterium]ACA16460.1 KpsF/GutQ family protein [Methylobacterium sp. 4-46]WFT82170.1 KpsF/GutQ family sugar-phosphate isomerase [Methylobacterium nodulans]
MERTHTAETAESSAAQIVEAGHFSAIRTIRTEAEALHTLARALDGELRAGFAEAVAAIHASPGRVFVSGIGKSGHIARKIAATLASTGTPATFIHPSEASHGDLGMITAQDIVIALSWSGETAELGDIVSFAKRFTVPLIALTSNPQSTLGLAADILLPLPLVKEACPHNLAPTSSSVMQLALGDALAIALLERRGFSASDFKVFHPGGKLAARLKTVRQLMHTDDEMPLVPRGIPMSEALLAIMGKRFGCAGVVDEAGRLVGIITNGDLRRHMGSDLLHRPVDAIMTPAPITVLPGGLASAALEMMNRRQITAMFVVEGGRPIGILHIHDLLQVGVA